MGKNTYWVGLKLMIATEVEAQKQRNFKNVSIRFSIRMNYVLSPLDSAELIDVVVKAGYARTAPLPPRRPTGVRFGFTGTIAQKGETMIDINDERGFLGATGPSPASAIQGLNEVLQLVKTNLKVDLEGMAAFYEMIGNLEVETDVNPLEKIGQLSERNKSFEEFGKIMDEDVAPFSLKLIPKGKIPNQTEWFEITIKPDLIKPTTYRITAVYRSKDKSKVQKFVNESMSKISKILDTIESA